MLCILALKIIKEYLRLVPSSLNKGGIVPKSDQSCNTEGQGQYKYRRNPERYPCCKSVKVVPASVRLRNNYHHYKIDSSVNSNGDQGEKGFPDLHLMGCDKQAKGENIKYRADAVEEESRAREDQHESLDGR